MVNVQARSNEAIAGVQRRPCSGQLLRRRSHVLSTYLALRTRTAPGSPVSLPVVRRLLWQPLVAGWAAKASETRARLWVDMNDAEEMRALFWIFEVWIKTIVSTALSIIGDTGC